MFLLEVVEALSSKGVSFAIAGGCAVALHGAVRGTVDVDLVVALCERDYLNCETALKSIGLQPKLPVGARDVFRFREEYIRDKNLKAWSFCDPNDGSRLVDIVITFSSENVSIKWVPVANIQIPILEKKELIKMKRESGRPQDIEDIRALEELD